jgi:hypothetical protein
VRVLLHAYQLLLLGHYRRLAQSHCQLVTAAALQQLLQGLMALGMAVAAAAAAERCAPGLHLQLLAADLQARLLLLLPLLDPWANNLAVQQACPSHLHWSLQHPPRLLLADPAAASLLLQLLCCWACQQRQLHQQLRFCLQALLL